MKLLLLGLIMLPTLLVASKTATPGSRQWVLENDQLRLTVQGKGAIISDLHRKAGNENWLSPKQENSQGLYAHFLSFDRWGPVTRQERKLGIPFHGEAVRQNWTATSSDPLAETLQVTLPVAKLQASRTVRLAALGSAFRITTTVENPTSETRPYNAVEHVTLSSIGYAEETRVSTNATHGFVQMNGKLVPESTFRWPVLTLREQTWNLRDWVRVQGMLITSLIFDDNEPWGWACVENPTTGELLGYVWSTQDYPWLMLWTHYKNGRVVNRALEPGTTGLHRPLSELIQTAPMLDRPLVHYLNPGEQQTRRLWGFVLPRPAGASSSIKQVSVEEDAVIIAFDGNTETLRLPF